MSCGCPGRWQPAGLGQQAGGSDPEPCLSRTLRGCVLTECSGTFTLLGPVVSFLGAPPVRGEAWLICRSLSVFFLLTQGETIEQHTPSRRAPLVLLRGSPLSLHTRTQDAQRQPQPHVVTLDVLKPGRRPFP